MTRYIALLRAVNLAGHGRLAMADLRAVLTDLGFTAVRTALQSGNAVFDVGQSEEDGLAERIEAALAHRLSLSTAVIVRSAPAWRQMIDANPFPDMAERAPAKLLVMPLRDAPPAGAVDRLAQSIDGPEAVALAGSDLFITYPNGIGRSKLTAGRIDKALETTGTARNWNTVMTLQRLIAEPSGPDTRP